MKRTLLSSAILGPVLALAALLVPGIAAAAGPIPASSACSAAGTTVTCDLWAKSGTLTLPSGSVPTSVPIWGYSDTASGPAKVPGPVLIVNAGDIVTLTLHNGLSRPTSIQFGGQAMVSDTTGAPAGGTQVYTFTAGAPGTYLYEAGLIPGAQYQAAMGLHGALVVRPAGGLLQVNGDAATTFVDESLVVLGEIDPTLNTSTQPWTYDLRKFAPKLFLVNGAPFSSSATPSIGTTGGNSLLLRYLNAGIQHHSVAALGLRQRVIQDDGSALPAQRTMVAETLAPGQTADVLVSVPVTAATSTKYPIYDAAMLLNNNNVNIGSVYGIGGMLALVDAAGVAPGTDTAGPVTSGVTLTPAGTDLYTLTATTDDTTTGATAIAAAQYRVDSGALQGMVASDGAFDETVEAVTLAGPIDTSTWSSGTHTVYVRGQDAAGNWGAFSSTAISLDKLGPTVSDLTLSPASPSGIALAGTASDVATGNSNIMEAEYFVGATGANGDGVAMAVNYQSPIASITATIPDGTTGVVSVHALDAAGNWGGYTTITIASDGAGPTTTGVSASPNPNNGALGINSSTPAVRVTASFDDASFGGSTIAAGEGFIDSLGTNGTGFPFAASDGVFNAVAENGTADIPLTTINLLSVGNHTIYVHGRDAAGNWGAAATTTLVIEKTPPAISSINRVDPSPTTAASVSFLVTFSEDVVGVTSGNFTVVSGGGLTGASITSVSGTGATRTVTVSTGPVEGTLGLNLTSATGIRDVAGNALPAGGLPFVGQVYSVAKTLYFSTFGNTNPPGVAGTADDADIYLWNGAAFSRVIDASAAPYSLPTGANVDGFDRVDATHFYASFNGNVAVPGVGTVADEDVVYYNAGTWSLYYDGSVNGLAGTDLDAINISGGTLYFSTDDTDIPPGVTGAGDDADIYSWDGSTYARVRDASALGWSTTNVDGLVWVDATHVYLSYSADTTVPGLGAVQDEDVVYLNGATWTVYVDGTAKGLTAGDLDVDAFDLP